MRHLNLTLGTLFPIIIINKRTAGFASYFPFINSNITKLGYLDITYPLLISPYAISLQSRVELILLGVKNIETKTIKQLKFMFEF